MGFVCLIDLGFWFGFWFLCLWVSISLLCFRLEINWRVQPAKPMTRVDGFEPNIWSVVGPISVHPIQLAWVWVNPKPNPTWSMYSPTHTRRLHHAIFNQTHKSSPSLYNSNPTFHLQQFPLLCCHFQLPTSHDEILLHGEILCSLCFLFVRVNLRIQNKAKSNLGIIGRINKGNIVSKSAFSYSISKSAMPKCTFRLIVISKVTIWKSYQTLKKKKKKKKKILIWNHILGFWPKNP